MSEPKKSVGVWPWTEAPAPLCDDGNPHAWKCVDWAQMYEPPVPTVACTKCDRRWTRKFTPNELRRYVGSDPAALEYFAVSLKEPDVPTYSDGSAAHDYEPPSPR